MNTRIIQRQAAMQASSEALARGILLKFYREAEPTPRQLAAAMQQVNADPTGAAMIVFDLIIPEERDDLRWARHDGRYVDPADRRE